MGWVDDSWRWATGRRAPRGGAEVPGVVPRRGPHRAARRVTGYEGLIAAQQCLPDNATRDRFSADYSYLARLWEAIPPDPSLSRPRNPPRTLLHHRGARRTDAGTRPRSRASRRLAKVDSKGFVPEAARAAERRNPCLTAKRSGYGVLAVRQGFEPWEEVNAPFNGLANRRLQPLGHLTARRRAGVGTHRNQPRPLRYLTRRRAQRTAERFPERHRPEPPGACSASSAPAPDAASCRRARERVVIRRRSPANLSKNQERSFGTHASSA